MIIFYFQLQCANSDQVGYKAETGRGTINEGGYGQNDARRLKKNLHLY